MSSVYPLVQKPFHTRCRLFKGPVSSDCPILCDMTTLCITRALVSDVTQSSELINISAFVCDGTLTAVLSIRSKYPRSYILLHVMSTVGLTIGLTSSIKQSIFSEANTSSASPEIPRIIWNPEVQYSLHKSYINPFHVPHHISWRTILIWSSHLRLGLSSGPLPSCFPTKTVSALLSHTTQMPHPSHSSWFDPSNSTGRGRAYRSWSSSLHSFLS